MHSTNTAVTEGMSRIDAEIREALEAFDYTPATTPGVPRGLRRGCVLRKNAVSVAG